VNAKTAGYRKGQSGKGGEGLHLRKLEIGGGGKETRLGRI